MKVLLTGANGYIGKRVLFRLLEEGHHVVAFVRSAMRLPIPERFKKNVQVIEGDLLKPKTLESIPKDIDAAYYLVHSMTTTSGKFNDLESESARNFTEKMALTNAKQIIYLSGLVNDENLSRHLASRKNVEDLLRQGKVPVTTLMAGIIIGSGSASFEIMRDLVEKLPVMIAPKWTKNKVQPIAIRDVLDYLILVLNNPQCIGQRFEIGGPDVYSYKELLLKLAEIRGLKRCIINVPVLTPTLSSYWLYFITSASFPLAKALVESLKNNAICKERSIEKILPKTLFDFETAVKRAFYRLEEDAVPSSWKDALGGSELNPDFSTYLQVPEFGTYVDQQVVSFSCSPREVKERIWTLGGRNGWRYMNWAWNVRGFFDRLFGGVGLRRGRSDQKKLNVGDALDFWRVLALDEKKGRLLLYAEMKLPGEAWLEFKIEEQSLYQRATFRPKGVWGRLYWILLYPFHYLIFRGLAKSLC
ncbi:MAG: DUF2867 domain-containing protein [Chlamydiae bacterium CG10_big_fil_rev_8_21_14_0_10_42_34]|nr:MAG: DUF2867 domain-containing protein [Chlamydiae bacterium CG10_big_fil_rev_8_21_14_0_10_42_34]